MTKNLRFQLWWLCLVVLALVGKPAMAQVAAPDWQAAVAAAAGTLTVQASTPSADGTALYLVGSFSGTATFGGTQLTTTNAQDAFVAKWNLNSGAFAWAVRATSPGGQSQANAVVGVSAALFVVGSFTGSTLALGNAAPVGNAQAGTSDIFVARLTDIGNSAGTVPMLRSLGGTADDFGTAVTSYSSSICYVGGSTGGTATFGTSTLAGAGGFVVTLPSSTFTQPTPVRVGGSVAALTVASNGAVYAAGSFGSATNTFGSSTLTSAGGDDAFVARLGGNTLTYGWVQRAGGTGNDYARTLLLANSGLYVGGSNGSASASFGGTTLSGAGGGSLFVAKMTDAGAFTWAAQSAGGTNAASTATGLAAYGTSVYVAGTYGGTATFGGSTLTSAGGADVVLAKLTDEGSSGAFVWGQTAGGAGADAGAGLARVGTRLIVGGHVSAPASFGSLGIGTGQGSRPAFVASLTDAAPVLTLAAPNLGPAGSTTSFYGFNLGSVTSIQFAGGVTAAPGFTVNAAGTQITGVVVPAGAQSGPVNATSAQGTSNSLISFQVLPGANPAPAWQTAGLADQASGASAVQWAQPTADGNVVVAGTFAGNLTLGGTSLLSTGGSDLFVAKYSPATGTYLWAQQAGGTDNEFVYGLAVQGSSVYVAGFTYGQAMTFGSTTLTPASGLFGYVAKLTDAGSSASWTWALPLTDNSGVYLEALAVSGSSVYVGGDYTGSALTIGSGAGSGTLSGQESGDDGFVAKLVDNGTSASFAWGRRIGNANSVNSNTVNVYGLVVRGSTVYAAGVFYGSLDFDGHAVTSQGNSDLVVARLTDAGTSAAFTDALRLGGTGDEYLLSMTGQGNQLYLAGESSSPGLPGSSAIGQGSYDALVAKVVDGGGAGLALAWAQLMGGPQFDRACQVAVNGTGVYVVGYAFGASTFGATTLLGAGGTDGYVARLADAGSSASVSWVRASGGLGFDSNQALALLPGQVWVGGSVTPNAAFGALAFTSPQGVSAATLASLNDATVLAAAPGAAPVASRHVYPNPAHGTATVQLPAGGSPGLSLLDVRGQEVRRYPATSASEAILDLRSLPAGLYLLRTGSGSALKLVVE